MTDSRKLTRPILIVLVAIGIYKWGQLHPKEIIPWRDNFAAAKAESVQTGKPLFLYFTATWCGPCQSLKSTTWADRGVANELANFIPTKLDVDNPGVLLFARLYGVDTQGIPFFVVLDKQGNEVRGAVGTMDPPMFLKWITGHSPEYDLHLPATQAQ
jgi:thiol:disulfide interchange protein